MSEEDNKKISRYGFFGLELARTQRDALIEAIGSATRDADAIVDALDGYLAAGSELPALRIKTPGVQLAEAVRRAEKAERELQTLRAAASEVSGSDADKVPVEWTTNLDGRANSSVDFEICVKHVERIIRGSAHDLIAGHANGVAGLIMAQVAHVLKLAPTDPKALRRELEDR